MADTSEWMEGLGGFPYPHFCMPYTRGSTKMQFTVEGLEKFPLSQAPMAAQEHMKEDPSDNFTDLWPYAGIYSCYEFQVEMVKKVGGKCLNAASANDPAGLGDLGAINLDVQTYEKHTNKNFAAMAKNFIHGTVFDIPFPDEEFDCVVLGEFLEHVHMDKAVEAILSCKRVMKRGGYLVLTFPLDGRPREEQLDRQIDPPWEYCPGVTTHHSHWWARDEFHDLKVRTGLVEVGRAALYYYLTAPLGGYGVLLTKP